MGLGWGKWGWDGGNGVVMGEMGLGWGKWGWDEG